MSLVQLRVVKDLAGTRGVVYQIFPDSLLR